MFVKIEVQRALKKIILLIKYCPLLKAHKQVPKWKFVKLYWYILYYIHYTVIIKP